jgi:hypothetical protein
MTRYRMLALAVLAVLLACAVTFRGLRAGPEQPAPKWEQVQELLKRVERLEARVAELERHQPRVIVPPQGTPELRVVPEAPLDLQRVPKNWIPREFNGQRYYDIPLDRGSPGR